MKFKRGGSLSSLLRESWSAIEGERAKFITFVLLFIFSYSTELLIPWAIGYTIGIFVTHGFTEFAYEKGFQGISIYFALRLLSIILHHLGRYLQNSVAYCAKMRSLNRIFTALINYHLNWHVSQHSGENLAKLNRSTLAVKNVIGQYSWQVLEGLVKVSIAACALFALDFWVAVNVAAMSVVTICLMLYFNGRMTRSIRVNNLFENKLNRICLDYLCNILTVKALALEKIARTYLAGQKDEGLAYSKTLSRYSELKWAAISIGYALVMASSLMIYFFSRRSGSAALDVAQVYVLISYLDKIFQSISSFTAYFTGIVESCTAYEDGSEITMQAPADQPEQRHSKLLHRWNSLVLSELNFSYIPGEQESLNTDCLHFKRGEKIALIGPSGCGKSTLLKVLGGALIPDKVSVDSDSRQRIDIQDIADIALLIPQDPQIFSETLLYNITMGEEIQNEKLLEIVSLCQLNQVVSKLADSWKTNLAQNGLNLSGGERQRIALARGLLRAGRKEIILLDEPTSSLDPRTEKELLKALFRQYPQHTIISSCHRWNLLPLFDSVIYLENGMIAQRGKPEDYLRAADFVPKESQEISSVEPTSLGFG